MGQRSGHRIAYQDSLLRASQGRNQGVRLNSYLKAQENIPLPNSFWSLTEFSSLCLEGPSSLFSWQTNPFIFISTPAFLTLLWLGASNFPLLSERACSVFLREPRFRLDPPGYRNKLPILRPADYEPKLPLQNLFLLPKVKNSHE